MQELLERLMGVVEANLGKRKARGVAIIDDRFRVWAARGGVRQEDLAKYSRLPVRELDVGSLIHDSQSFLLKVSDRFMLFVAMGESELSMVAAASLKGRINALSDFYRLDKALEEAEKEGGKLNALLRETAEGYKRLSQRGDLHLLVLCDGDGKVLAWWGSVHPNKLWELAALGSALVQMGKVGEDRLSSPFQNAAIIYGNYQLHAFKVCDLDGRMIILLAVAGEKASIGLVRMILAQRVDQLRALVEVEGKARVEVSEREVEEVIEKFAAEERR